MSENIVLEAKHLKKIYNYRTPNAFEALHDVNFQVYDGDFVAIMGPSGSGKSTFINTISTIDVPTGGRVFINQKEIRTMTENEIGKFRYENLGFIFQDFNLLDTHTMFENIAMPLSLAHVNKEDVAPRVNALAEEMGIQDLLQKFPYECSGGQRQRVAICRALINRPHIIVADEPTGNLDSDSTETIYELMRDINERFKTTFIIITHDRKIAEKADRIIELKDGRVHMDLSR